MKAAYIDCFAGISGDMMIGALLDLGVDFHLLEAELCKLNLEGYTIGFSKVTRGGIAATKFDVLTGDGSLQPTAQSDAPTPGHGDMAWPEKLSAHKPETHDHRSLAEIIALIAGASLSPKASDFAMKIFDRLATAEAKVHQIPREHVHFHEVGAIDSIVDIVGTAVCLDLLGLEKIIASPVNTGAGFVHCEHGQFPVPGPATAELLRGIPIYSEGPAVELTTPTGAAIISTVAKEFRRLKDFRVEAVGYGAGSRQFANFPNTLRILIGEELNSQSTAAETDDEVVSLLEANIDDMNPQIYGYLFDKALAEGALEIFTTPVQMKKSRPGQLLTIVCDPSKVRALSHLIFTETTTIGLRIHEMRRRVLHRSMDTIETQFGSIRVKVSRLNGTVLTATPEYEDCRRLAEGKGVALKDVLAEANAKIRTMKF